MTAFILVAVEIGPDGAPPVEVLDAAGRVLATAQVPDARVRSIVLPDGGRSTTLTRGIARVRVPWPDGAVALSVGGALRTPPPSLRAAGDAVPLVSSGPAQERLDLVLLGDGYTEAELDAFADDADTLVAYLRDIPPYDRYADLLNVWRVDRASDDSGVSHPGQPRDTVYGCAYDCGGIPRLVCCDDDRVVSVVDQALPAGDGILVLLNDDEYGGSGGFTYATAYTGPVDGVRVAAHELGHSLVGLWDEYSYGISGPGEGPNCATGSDGWDAWLGVQGVDAFPECSYTNLYRPTDDGYCPVCREQVVLALHERLGGLVRSTDPPADSPATETISVETSVDPERLDWEWTLDGGLVAETASEVDVTCTGWRGTLALRVHDPTGWVRTDPDGLLADEAGPWPVDAAPCEDAVSCGCRAPAPYGLGALPVLALWRRRRWSRSAPPRPSRGSSPSGGGTTAGGSGPRRTRTGRSTCSRSTARATGSSP